MRVGASQPHLGLKEKPDSLDQVSENCSTRSTSWRITTSHRRYVALLDSSQVAVSFLWQCGSCCIVLLFLLAAWINDTALFRAAAAAISYGDRRHQEQQQLPMATSAATPLEGRGVYSNTEQQRQPGYGEQSRGRAKGK